jgi:hypothetical protein
MIKISIPLAVGGAEFGATYCDFNNETHGPGAEIRSIERDISGGGSGSPSTFSIDDVGFQSQFVIAKSTLRN